MTKVTDSTLVFVIPDVENGQYELKTELGNIEFNVSKTVVINSEEIISNVFTTFDNEVNPMENSQELDDTKAFKNELTELYNSLSTKQKKEVAMFYEANKEIFRAFKQNVALTYDAPTTLKSSIQSDCPKTDFKSFYSCTSNNLGNSINELGSSIKKIAEPIAYAAAIGKLASTTWYLGPSVWALTAVGASLSIGTAIYILITEVRPAFISFKSNLTPFMKANWILTKATFEVVTDEFNNDTETDLNLNAKFRSIEETDSDVSSKTSFFISAYGKLSSVWNDFSKVLGNIPSFSKSEESIELETNDITISNISNSNVELVRKNGEKVKFKSLSGNEENFSFDITVNKEGFTQITQVDATITAVDSLAIYKAAFVGSYKVEDFVENGDIESIITLIAEPNGTGYYDVILNGQQLDPYPVAWTIIKHEGKYIYQESGGWFNNNVKIIYDNSLPNNYLTIPVTTFSIYASFLEDGNSLWRIYTKN